MRRRWAFTLAGTIVLFNATQVFAASTNVIVGDGLFFKPGNVATSFYDSVQSNRSAVTSPSQAAEQLRFPYSASVSVRYDIESSTVTMSTANYTDTNTALHDAVIYRMLRLTEP